MIYLMTNHGTGDTYMTLAFAKAVERLRSQPVTVSIPAHHAAIAAMFPNVQTTVGTPVMNALSDDLIVAHPSAVPKRVRIDHLCLLARRLTHADLWRAMLDLPPDEPMVRGAAPIGTPHPRTVTLIREARSWPMAAPGFWDLLEHFLREAGWHVKVNGTGYSLGELLDLCACSEWVIGPQCGVMMILCHAGFPCRKTFATASVDGHAYFRRTWPYASVETFAGEDYADVDEVIVRDAAAAREVMDGACARGLDRGRGCVSGVSVTLSHGEFFDRLSILDVKQQKLTGERRAAMMRDYLRAREVGRPMLTGSPTLSNLYADLLAVNWSAFEQNDVAVRAVQNGDRAEDHYARAVHLNRQRTELKDRINALCASSGREVKSYYD